MKPIVQSSLLAVTLALLVTGCSVGQSAQPVPTAIPSTEQASTPPAQATATAVPSARPAIPAASPTAATPVIAASPVAATPVLAGSPAAATPIASLMDATPVPAASPGAATPVASAAAEVIVLRLGRAASELARGNDMVFHTITFQPGSSLRPHSHPGETIFHLESGTLAFTLLEGEARLVRGTDAIPSAATPAASDAVPVGVEIEVNAGDTLYYDESAVQTERNLGSEDAVATVLNLRGAEEPRVVQVQEMSTPAATPVSGGAP